MTATKEEREIACRVIGCTDEDLDRYIRRHLPKEERERLRIAEGRAALKAAVEGYPEYHRRIGLSEAESKQVIASVIDSYRVWGITL